jgi:hypothetical protein
VQDKESNPHWLERCKCHIRIGNGVYADVEIISVTKQYSYLNPTHKRISIGINRCCTHTAIMTFVFPNSA